MDQWIEIRRRVLVEGVSKRQVLRETGMHWTTLEKILANDQPPGYRRVGEPAKPKIGPYLGWIGEVLKSDQAIPRKQRHTARRIWERLRDERGFTGGYTIVKEAVRELTRHRQEVFLPLTHRPGEAQVDFGQALARIGGVLRKVHFFVMALPYSDAMFVMAFERECTESFWEGHVRALSFFGAVPGRIAYDNTRVAVSKIVGTRARRLTQGFQQLVSHYLFAPHFCRVRRANEKGVVEGTVRYARQHFLVPVPQVRDFTELNARLLNHCREDLSRRLRGQSLTKGNLLLEERTAMRSLPATAFDGCRQQSTRVNSQSLVRFDDNDYSAPVAWAHHAVVVRGYMDRVEIGCGRQKIATHPRCWQRQQQVFTPEHYLPLLERKPGGLDHARPLEGWALPACFDTLRRRLEAEREDGTREYIRVLRLLEGHGLQRVRAAVEKGLRVRAHTRDAVAQFLLPAEPWRQTVFRLDGREHLRHVRVNQADIGAYRTLLAGVGGGP